MPIADFCKLFNRFAFGRSIQHFIDHLQAYENEQAKLPLDKRDLFATCTDPQIAFDCMIECFLGEKWYVAYPACTKQVNTEACFEILYKHNRKFRRYVKKLRKESRRRS